MDSSPDVLRRCVEPLLDPSLAHVCNIRVGTKALTYWPHRFVTDTDADELLDAGGAGETPAPLSYL